MNVATGTFEIQMQAEPPYSTHEGVSLNRASFDKTFSGPLNATSVVDMMAARTPTPGSAAYVALERITGTLEGRTGSFVAVHLGLMGPDGQSLTITIVPDSGTGALQGIQGSMDIQIVEGQHFYTLTYALEP